MNGQPKNMPTIQRHPRFILPAVILITLMVGVAVAQNSRNNSQVTGPPMKLQLTTSKGEYLVGEPVHLFVRLINTGDATVVVYNNLKARFGDLQILIARDGQDYKEYHGPWPMVDVEYALIDLPSKSAITEKVTLVYTGGYTEKEGASHLSEVYARKYATEARNKFLRQGYVFSKSGTYFIKAIVEQKEERVESEPLQIELMEPVGIDQAAWDLIGKDAAFAYFIQTGSPQGHPVSAKTHEVVDTLESVVNLYPTSRYAESIRSSLSKHHSSLKELEKKGLIAP